MSQIYLKRILQIYIFTALAIFIVLLLALLTPADALSNVNTLTNTSQYKYSEIPQSNFRPEQTCEGNWLWIPTAKNRIDLDKSTIQNWSFESNPSVLVETEDNNNKVMLGHNICNSSGCFEATTDFAQIINLKFGDVVKSCINDFYYESTVKFSSSMPETSTQILGDWLGGESLTLFTCYGECKDEICQSSKDRWVVGVQL